MLRFGPVALVGALTCLVYSHQSNTAVGVRPSIADSLLPESVVEPVHYSRRYGWHCGMRNYGHEHREACQRRREGTGLGDDDCLGRGDVLLRIETCRS
jgi:hypothetical protein